MSKLTSSRKLDKSRRTRLDESLYKDYVRSYIFFSHQYPLREQLKERLLNSRNLPMLLNKMHFDDKLIKRALCDYIRLHKCNNKHFNGFSRNKCSECRQVRYCDEDCQKMDHANHHKLCPKMKEKREKTYQVGLILQKELQKRNSQPKLYSFEFFISSVMESVFQAFSGCLNEESLKKIIEKDLHNHNFGQIDWNNLGQLSSHRTVDRNRLKSQMWYQFGEENFLADTNQETVVPVIRTDKSIDLLLTILSLTEFLKLLYNLLSSIVGQC